jgi:hypothetical protein
MQASIVAIGRIGNPSRLEGISYMPLGCYYKHTGENFHNLLLFKNFFSGTHTALFNRRNTIRAAFKSIRHQ